MSIKIFLSLFSFLPSLLIAQKITISGYVKDASSKEALIGASVVNANNKTGTSTNQYGFYSLTVPVADTIELLISFQGYKINAKKVVAKENMRIEILLENSGGTLGEVIITSGKIITMFKNRKWVLLMCR